MICFLLLLQKTTIIMLLLGLKNELTWLDGVFYLWTEWHCRWPCCHRKLHINRGTAEKRECDVILPRCCLTNSISRITATSCVIECVIEMISWDRIFRHFCSTRKFLLSSSFFLFAVEKALEKNQQWLAYDQQREAYVNVVLAEKCQLEQELHQAIKAQLQKKVDSEGEVVIMTTSHRTLLIYDLLYFCFLLLCLCSDITSVMKKGTCLFFFRETIEKGLHYVQFLLTLG